MKEGPIILHDLMPTVPAHVSYTWLAMVILIGLAIAVRLRITGKAPTGVQNFFETIIKGLEDFMEEIMGPEGLHYFALIASLFLFILISNLMGLVPGFESPTSNINTTLALALCSFTATHYIGLRKHGIGYVKHFLGPMWALAPLMFIIEGISHVARVISLSFRLFGNMIAKHKLLVVLVALVPYFVPSLVLALGLFVAFIQAGVFTLLTMLYLTGSIEEAHIGGHH